MFRLPTCPYCKTIYRYGDVKKTIKQKNQKCYHCGKNIRISRKGLIVWFVLLIFAGAVINLVELNLFKNINFVALTVTNIVTILVFLLFTPFFVGYKTAENTDKDIPKSGKHAENGKRR